MGWLITARFFFAFNSVFEYFYHTGKFFIDKYSIGGYSIMTLVR